jgi:predicted ATPase/DNA-binding SARP family transcriptional activator
MQIALLGPLAVRDHSGAPVEVGGRRVRTLLTVLALRAGQVVSSTHLIDRIWGGDPPEAALNALQALVSRLRRSLPPGLVESHPAGYRLAVEPDAVDVHRFERLIATATGADDPRRTAAALDEALSLWRGPPLAEATPAGFTAGEVARLDELRMAAVEDLAAAGLRLGDGRPVVAELEALVAGHPTRERAAGLLMRALAAAGRGGEALHAYERTRTALADLLGADPSPELAALHRRLLRGETGQPVRSAGGAGQPVPPGGDGSPRTNLRAGLTSFIGRDEDITRVGKLVTEYRLTTLTGPGGAGKTRLAIESARTLLGLGQLPDGVWLVELAPLTDAAELPKAVLTVLGLREQAMLAPRRIASPDKWARHLDALGDHLDAPPGAGPYQPAGAEAADLAQAGELVDRLVGALSGKRLLVVLDNCEHLVDAAAALADRLLGECPQLRILATSRESLGITGETLWPVEPLALPPVGAGASQAASYPAVRMLADRAAAARPGFAVGDGTVADVVRICRALDGLPLAIELAAARLRTMTAAQLADRLDRHVLNWRDEDTDRPEYDRIGARFRLLNAGSRTALPRHRTLQAVVDWSWALLSDAERRVLRRLAWFVGGAPLAAAEQVCAGDGVRPDQVLDLLTALIDKSLVAACGTGEPRYELLETIREYGLARLADAGEADLVRRRHAGYFLALARAAEPRLRTGDQLRWLRRLGEDHENLHAAVRGAIDAGDPATAVRLAAALGWYWWLGGHRREGVELAGEALAMPVSPADEPDTVVRALAYVGAAMNAIDGTHDEAKATAWFGVATELAATTGREHPLLRLVAPISELLQTWAWGAEPPTGEDDPEPAAPGHARALDRLIDDPDPWVRATARLLRGHATLNTGRNHLEAERDFEAGLADFRQAGDRWGGGVHAELGREPRRLARRLRGRGGVPPGGDHFARRVRDQRGPGARAGRAGAAVLAARRPGTGGGGAGGGPAPGRPDRPGRVLPGSRPRRRRAGPAHRAAGGRAALAHRRPRSGCAGGEPATVLGDDRQRAGVARDRRGRPGRGPRAPPRGAAPGAGIHRRTGDRPGAGGPRRSRDGRRGSAAGGRVARRERGGPRRRGPVAGRRRPAGRCRARGHRRTPVRRGIRARQRDRPFRTVGPGTGGDRVG